jgi:RNA polymerase sigma-70 factor (ECF subfamily)
VEASTAANLRLTLAESVSARARGSDAAFEEMYLAAWPRLCRYAWVLVRHQEDAEDVASETVRRAFAAWQAGRGPASDPMPWLFLIARRIVLDRRKSRALRWLSLSRVTEDPPARGDSLAGVEAAVWFEQLRGHLTERQHEAIVLRYLFDLSDEQIGRIMGLSAGGVRTNVFRALEVLRKRPEVLDR